MPPGKPKWEWTLLERATAIAELFVPTQKLMWSSLWPLGHCGVSSLLLNPLLTAGVLELETAVVVGVCLDNRQHAWIETKHGDVIDPTFGQFTNEVEDLIVVPSHAATTWQGEIRLTPEQEDFYRRSIMTQHEGGWRARSGIAELFYGRRRVCPMVAG